MSNFKIGFQILTGEFERQVEANADIMAAASTGAMDQVSLLVKAAARADIARAGFGPRWQNTLRTKRYPEGRVRSMNAAVSLTHKIQYAGVFEDGATIKGSPFLWIRLPTTPTRIGRSIPMTPEAFSTNINDLVSMKSKSGTPLLGAEVRVPRTQATVDRPKVSMAALRRGKTATRGVLRTIPLFYGIRVANIKKQLNIREICARQRDRIPALYAANLKVD